MTATVTYKSGYDTLLSHLVSRSSFGGIHRELKNISALCLHLDNPHTSFNSIHITGTNGKSSVAAKVAHALELEGYTVGLFTSPHISSFRERIMINGIMIPEDTVTTILNELFLLISHHSIPATFFELTTALAFKYFADNNVDFAIIETGCGARYDATNIITPLVTVITSVHFDHTDTLGHTIHEISKEKSGIIKRGCPIIAGITANNQVIQKKALWNNCIFAPQPSHNLDLDQENSLLAKKTLEHLPKRYKLSSSSIEHGCAYKLPCRCEYIAPQQEGYPEVLVFDSARNPDAFYRFMKTVTARFPHKKLRIFVDLSHVHDKESCLDTMKSYTTNLYILSEPEKLFFKRECAKIFFSLCEQARDEGEILVTIGSPVFLKHIRQTIGLDEPYDYIDIDE
jgi:dihydrofolate synthase / folylpolyglutamate synthase